MNTSSKNAQTFAGACQCGQVRYQVTGQPITLFACHCKDCQRQSASAFGMALWVRLGSVQLHSGALRDWRRTTPSGRHMLCQFCEQCGTRLFHRLTDQPTVISIKPGTLDDTAWLHPVGHLWMGSKQSWLQPALTGVCYEGNPEQGMDDLMAAWERQSAGLED